jgi:hypothetical protein
MKDMFGTRRSGRTTVMIQRAAQHAKANPSQRIAIVMATAERAQAIRHVVVQLENLRVTSLTELGVDFDPAKCSAEGYDSIFLDHGAVEMFLLVNYQAMLDQAWGLPAKIAGMNVVVDETVPEGQMVIK